MSRELRHIILITLLAIAMTGCTDSPAPSRAPEPQRPLCFTASPAVIYPIAGASRADAATETEVRTAFEGNLTAAWTQTISADKFDGICTGPMTIYGKGDNLQILSNYSNKLGEVSGRSDLEEPIVIEIPEDKVSLIKDYGINLGSSEMGNGVFIVTKVTYTAVKSTGTDPGTDPENPDTPVPGATGGLTYDGLNTTFNEGTLIGCVIAKANAAGSAEPYTYLANSCWTWHPAGLELTKLFGPDNAHLDITDNTIIRHFTPGELADIDGAAADPAAPYYIKLLDPAAPYYIKLLDPAADYAFFFYYPYIDETILTKACEDTYSNYQYHLSNSVFPSDNGTIYSVTTEEINKHTLIQQVGNTEWTADNTALHRSAWTDYPVATHADYSTSTAKLHNVDFMYSKVELTPRGMPINATNAKSQIPVVMQKELVTMDMYVLQGEVIDGSLKLKAGTGSDYKPAMRRIKRFDMMQGKFIEDFEYANNSDNRFITCSRFSSEIIPCKIGAASEVINGELAHYDIYRVILPPQDASQFRCSLTFSVNSAGGGQKTLTLNQMHQNSGIKSLEGGHYYKLRFTKLNEKFGFHLDIHDWEKGEETTIHRPD